MQTSKHLLSRKFFFVIIFRDFDQEQDVLGVLYPGRLAAVLPDHIPKDGNNNYPSIQLKEDEA